MYYCIFHKKWINDKDNLKKKCLENKKSDVKGIKYKKCKYLIELNK